MEFDKARAFILHNLECNLPEILKYHSYTHVLDVYDAAERLASIEGISGRDLALLRTAVLYHDCGFTIQLHNHEMIGCGIARETLPQFDYTSEDIEQICGMIMATKIPQTPNNLLEQIICDADLDYLGRTDFWDIGNKLFQELMSLNAIKSEQEWSRIQLVFLNQHQYFTNSPKNLRAVEKENHLQKIKHIVANYSTP
jgi:predicted metal-dependent HD superfamily phosphohydrolase